MAMDQFRQSSELGYQSYTREHDTPTAHLTAYVYTGRSRRVELKYRIPRSDPRSLRKSLFPPFTPEHLAFATGAMPAAVYADYLEENVPAAPPPLLAALRGWDRA